MISDLLALLDKPVALLIALTIGGLIGIGVERLVEGQKRAQRRAYWRGRNAKKNGDFGKKFKAVPLKGTPERAGLDAAEQLRRVMDADFKPRALLNKPEAQVFKALDAAVIARNPGWQVMAQVSLGEFLASEDKDAFFSVNSKRVDFALMDPRCCVQHAIEYHGTGHHLPGGAAAARDAVKQEALRKAKIGYHPIVAGHTTPADLKRLVDKLVPAA
jgi:hypothetical protein